MRTKSDKIIGFCLAAIPVVGFLLFGLIPMGMSVVMSFLKIKGFNFDSVSWVGFDNYFNLLFGEYSEKMYLSIFNSLVEWLALPISLAFALVISVFLNKDLKGTTFFRTVYFLPYICSTVAITTMWKWLFEEEFGILNQLLMGMGIEPIGWISDSLYVRGSMLITCVWSGMSLGIILYSAAMKNVSKAYYEAAQIDGAGEIRQFFVITLPAISPTTFFLLVTQTIGYLQDFVRYQVMLGNSGGPSNSGLTMVFYLWQMAFRYNVQMGMGYACACAVIVALIIGAATLMNYLLGKKWVCYDF